MFHYLKKRLYSFVYAFRGLVELLSGRHQNALIHLLAIVVVTIFGFWLNLEAWEWVAVLLCFGIVLALEAVNSAIESLCDLSSPDFHPLAGKAKDLAAAAVLIGALIAVLVAAIILYGKLF